MSHAGSDSLRSPLGRARGLGSARSGSHHWWVHRVTSVMLIPLSVYLLWQARHFLPAADSYASLIVLLSDPVTATAIALTLVIGFHHTYQGLQVVIEDYVHGHLAKTALMVLSATACVFLSAAGLIALARIAFSTGLA